MFDLETAIATWRHALQRRRVFSREDLDELEDHVRGHVEALVAGGVPEEAAFRQALHDVGDYASTEEEYRKVYWAKARHRRRLSRALMGELTMLHNYFKVALRALLKQKSYAFINIAGLAVGLACCLVILLYVWDEWQYDRHHALGDRIYRLALDGRTPSGTFHAAVSALPFAPALREAYPEIEAFVRFKKSEALFRQGEASFQESNLLLADSAFFEVFTFPLLSGDPATALDAPYSVVLTKPTAEKYFGRYDVLGATLQMNDTLTVTVTGVLADVPNTHLPLGMLLSLSTWEAVPLGPSENWSWFNFYTYLLLREGTDPDALSARIYEYAQPRIAAQGDDGVEYAYPLQPLRSIYLHSNRGGEIGPTGDVARLYLFSLIAALILLVACINFMNLATARSAGRAREVGMRKVIGAGRAQLIRQFLGESMLQTGVAFVLGVGLCLLILPSFNALFGKAISAGTLFRGAIPFALVGLGLLVGLLAGSYPAFVLSGFQPVQVLKGPASGSPRGAALRKVLVVFQFAVSIVLIAGTAVVSTQLDFMRGQSLGFDREHLLTIDFQRDAAVIQRYEAVKQALGAHPQVRSVGTSDYVPGGGYGNVNTRIDAGNGETLEEVVPYYLIDYDFLDTYGIPVVAGRGFSEDYPTDATEAFLINEAAVDFFGWASPEEAVGKSMALWGRQGRIVGVVRDFHFASLHQAIEPLTLHIRPDWFSAFTLRLAPGDYARVIPELEAIWKEQVPGRPFNYAFLDESFDRQYRQEVQFRGLFGLFALLAVLIACLGLFGLAAFTAQQRTKEIGVRKVLGATTHELAFMQSKEFAQFVLIAFVVAAPVAYFALRRWLENFAYHIDLNPLILLGAGAAVLVIAVLTVGYQALKVARANPVDTLRYE